MKYDYICSLTDFCANAAALVEQVRGTGRPLVLTQHGRSAAVLLDVGVYEDLLEELELLRDVHVAEKQTAAGQTVEHGRARAEVKRRLRASKSRPPADPRPPIRPP